MFSIFVALCLFRTGKTSTISELQVQTVRQGYNVSMKCGQNIVKDGKSSVLFWYKMSLGKVPQYIVRTAEEGLTHRFAREFANDRFSVALGEEKFDLNINEVSEVDTGIYFCGTLKTKVVEFRSGTLLLFQAERIKGQLRTEMVFKSGEHSTLQCSLQALTENCAGQHSVYWFRQSSNKSHPEIIYTHGNESDRCKTGSDSSFPTRTCVYDLPSSYTRHSYGGTYYCAVAACGEILIGNGAKAEVEENNRWIVIALTICNVIYVISIVVLVGLQYKNQRKDSISDHSRQTNMVEDTEGLNYAALRFAQKPPTFEKPRDKYTSAVYVQVKI